MFDPEKLGGLFDFINEDEPKKVGPEGQPIEGQPQGVEGGPTEVMPISEGPAAVSPEHAEIVIEISHPMAKPRGKLVWDGSSMDTEEGDDYSEHNQYPERVTEAIFEHLINPSAECDVLVFHPRFGVNVRLTRAIAKTHGLPTRPYSDCTAGDILNWEEAVRQWGEQGVVLTEADQTKNLIMLVEELITANKFKAYSAPQ